MEIQKNPLEIVEWTLQVTNQHNEWRLRKTINLIASENVMSPLAMSVYLSDFEHRYAEGKPFKRYYEGTQYIDLLEDAANSYFAKLVNATYADTRPVSGTISNAAIFKALAQPGDKALIAPVQAGAHVSHTRFGTLGALGIEQVDMPYDEQAMNVDTDKAIKMVEEIEPKFIVLGGSVYLFPHPVKEIAEAAKTVGAKLVYDAAHVLGLIIGKAWRNPLEHGADVLTASTHKTFPGPQGGAYAVTDDKSLYKKIYKNLFPNFVSNHHLHRIPALLVTMAEMEAFGEAYAQRIVENARRLAESLAARGFKVVGEHLGYTKSHQVLVDVRRQGGGYRAAKMLLEANIIVNKNLLPYDPPDAIKDPSGLRIGVQEVTRFGMGPSEMDVIAEFFEKVLIRGIPVDRVANEVSEFRAQYIDIHYAFKPDDVSVKYIGPLSLIR
ncbi:MAG: serine hydroxymethyltransferase [Desulfurococcales archaeon]|nr:serine hydroxymethyltransferase [Desulfurococcales archaeon]